MKQISLIQVQAPTVAPTLITPTIVSPAAQLTRIDDGTVYIKNEPQIITSLPSTSTSTATLIIPASAEPPNEIIVSGIKDEGEIQIETDDDLNLLANTDEVLTSESYVPPADVADESFESTEIKMEMEEVTSG